MLQNTIVRVNGGTQSSVDDFTLFGKGAEIESPEADDMLERLKMLMPADKPSTG